MFDLITGNTTHIPARPALPIVMTSVAEAIALVVVVVLPVLFVTDNIPRIPTMMAFVAAPPAPPPPPPPPPAAKPPTPQPAKVAPTAGAFVAPIEAPASIEPEPAAPALADEGIAGGVEGGVPGGVVGGVVGGIWAEVPPPPPPPPPAAARGPVRIGGQLQAPALVNRVEPFYPPLAVRAKLSGVVILEATVDPSGRVVNANVLRSAGPLLDREALLAVKQWRYAPLLLNGKAESFILTVTLSFNLTEPTGE